MDYENIIYEKDRWTARITLDRPEKLNALNDALFVDLDSALEEVERDEEVRVVVIKGAGRAFSAGYDLQEMGTLAGKARSAGRYPTEVPPGTKRTVTELIKGDQRRSLWYQNLWNLSKPTIAQIHGYCLAGGCYLQMLCDLSIASEDATFGHPAQRMGGVSGMALWVWLLGVKKAKELFYTGKLIDAKEAEQIGLINKAVPADQLEQEVNNLIEQIIAIPPDGIALNKQAINTMQDIMGLGTSFRYLSQMHAFTHFIDHPEETNFGKIKQEKGLKAALEARDKPTKS